MSLIHSDTLKLLDVGSNGVPFCDIVAKSTILANGSLDYASDGAPFVSLAGVVPPPDVIEDTLGAVVGVQATMAADHLVEGVAAGVGLQTAVEGAITQLDVTVAAGAGVQATFQDEWHDLTVDLTAQAGTGFSVEGENFSQIRELLAAVGVQATFDPSLLKDVLSAAFGVEVGFARAVEIARALAADAGIRAVFSGESLSGQATAGAGLGATVQGSTDFGRLAIAACGTKASFEGVNWTALLRYCKLRASVQFSLQLTGGTGPLTIPISSFQGRYKSDDPSFLSVTVPGNDQYDDIVARADGDLILSMQYVLDGAVIASEIIMAVDLEAIDLDEGSSSMTITLSGHRTLYFRPKAVVFAGCSYKANRGGKLRYRGNYDIDLHPGDTVTIGEDEIIAGQVIVYANPDAATMEIEQGDAAPTGYLDDPPVWGLS